MHKPACLLQANTFPDFIRVSNVFGCCAIPDASRWGLIKIIKRFELARISDTVGVYHRMFLIFESSLSLNSGWLMFNGPFRSTNLLRRNKKSKWNRQREVYQNWRDMIAFLSCMIYFFHWTRTPRQCNEMTTLLTVHAYNFFGGVQVHSYLMPMFVFEFRSADANHETEQPRCLNAPSPKYQEKWVPDHRFALNVQEGCGCFLNNILMSIGYSRLGITPWLDWPRIKTKMDVKFPSTTNIMGLQARNITM